jgi:hypothetical protein
MTSKAWLSFCFSLAKQRLGNQLFVVAGLGCNHLFFASGGIVATRPCGRITLRPFENVVYLKTFNKPPLLRPFEKHFVVAPLDPLNTRSVGPEAGPAERIFQMV